MKKRNAGFLCVLAILLLSPLAVFGEGGKETKQETPQAPRSFSWRMEEGKSINVYLSNWAMTNLVKEKLPEFETKTGIKVNIQNFADSQLDQKLFVELVAKSKGVDVFQSRPWNQGRKFFRAGYYEDLDPYINNASLTNPDYNFGDFFDWSKQTSAVEGKRIGITINAATYLLFDREDLVKQHGVTVPGTMEELEQAARKLTLDTDKDGRTDIFGVTIRGKAGETEAIWGGFLRNLGGRWLDEKRNPDFHSDIGVKTLALYADTIRKYGPPGSQNYGWPEVSALMMEGRAAMAIDASPVFAFLADKNRSKFYQHIKAAPVPKGPNGNIPSVHGWNLNMSAYSTQKQAAWLFMQWYTSKEMYMEAFKRGFPVPRRSAWEQPGARDVVPDATWYDASLESFKTGGYYIVPDVVAGDEVRKEIGLAVSKAIEGGDPKALLAEAAKNVKAIMDKTE